MAALHEIQKVLDDPTLKLTRAVDTRWLSHDNATRTLAKCLPSVISSLEREAQERNDAQAMGLSVFVQTHKFLASLLMMRDILPHLSSLSKAMQTRDAVYTTVGPLVKGTIAVMTQLKTSPGTNYSSLSTTIEGLQGQNFNIKTPTDAQTSEFRTIVYDKFLTNIMNNLEARFPDLPLIECFGVFDASNFPEDASEHGNEEMMTLAAHFTLPQDKASEEWRLLKATIQQTPTLQQKRADQMMSYVCQLEASHPNIAKLAAVRLLIPTSTADCERGFSTLKRVKTTHRNSLSNKVLNALLAITMEGEPLEQFNFEAAVNTWYGEKTRRSAL